MCGRAAQAAPGRERHTHPRSRVRATSSALPGRVKRTAQAWAGAGGESDQTSHIPRWMRSGAPGGGESILRALSWLVQGGSALTSWLLTRGSFHCSRCLSTQGWGRSMREADSGPWGLVGKIAALWWGAQVRCLARKAAVGMERQGR